jgi:hypothetical protein
MPGAAALPGDAEEYEVDVDVTFVELDLLPNSACVVTSCC